MPNSISPNPWAPFDPLADLQSTAMALDSLGPIRTPEQKQANQQGAISRLLGGFGDAMADPRNREMWYAGVKDMTAGAAGRQGTAVESLQARRERESVREENQRRYDEAQQQAQAQLQKLRQWISTLPPELQQMAAANPLAFYKQFVENKFDTDDGTTQMRNAAAMGLAPGSPEYAKYINDVTMKPGTVVNMGPKLPAGYQWQDPGNPQAGVAPIPGGPALKPTAAQQKSAAFGQQMEAASERQAELEANTGYDKPAFWDWAAGEVLPDVVAGYLQSDEYAKYKGNAVDWTLANLRDESGAAIQREEAEQQWSRFWPEPWASAAVVHQKLQMRLQAEAANRTKSGPSGQMRRNRSNQGTFRAKTGITKAEYDALPPGSIYTAPDGVQRMKQ